MAERKELARIHALRHFASNPMIGLGLPLPNDFIKIHKRGPFLENEVAEKGLEGRT
jgi:hypothetical protein